jgi:hypothetical protein
VKNLDQLRLVVRESLESRKRRRQRAHLERPIVSRRRRQKHRVDLFEGVEGLVVLRDGEDGERDDRGEEYDEGAVEDGGEAAVPAEGFDDDDLAGRLEVGEEGGGEGMGGDPAGKR